MNSDSATIKLVIADNSPIVRSGLIAVLRHIPGLKIQPYEVQTQSSLQNYIFMHEPDLVIVNPIFDGWFDIKAFKAGLKKTSIKFMALLSAVIDSAVLKDYNDSFTIYDDVEQISTKIAKLLSEDSDKDQSAENENLSQREKEIIVGVVKGLTNKEIADKLCLSIHTVITHRRNVSRKLQIHSPAGLTIFAIVNGLVELNDIKNQSL
ncbi:MAG: response regulator transcription factor [Sodaliphilus sp.]|nr:response regulator transcription factor [Sodaliphilus sp.]